MRQRKIELSFKDENRKFYFILVGNNEILLNLLNEIKQENEKEQL